MVGTKPNGDPRCVPDDEVPDADFSESLTPAETKQVATGETDKAAQSEPDTQRDTMTDEDTDAPTLSDADIEAVAEAVAEKSDGDTDTDDTEKAGPLDTAVDTLMDMDEAPDDPGALRDGIISLLDAGGDDGGDPSLDELVAEHEKEVGPEDVADLIAAMDGVDASAAEVGEMLADLMDGTEEEDGMHGDEEKDADTEKSAEESNLSKGATVGAGTTADTTTDNTGLSYKALADEEAGEHL